ncbi:MAG: hypothetical protein R2911_00185 [Caldilineaceae bacterium]
MPQTSLSVQGEQFLINGRLTYAEIDDSNPNAHGLLMNARFIQGVFDDKAGPGPFCPLCQKLNGMLTSTPPT